MTNGMQAKLFTLILNIFDFLGFYTESSQNSRKNNFYYIFHFLSIGYFIFVNYYIVCYTFLNSFVKLLDVLNIRLQNSCALITYCLILTDSIIHRNDQYEFWKIYKKLSNLYQYYDDKKYLRWQYFIYRLIELISVVFVYFVEFLFEGLPISKIIDLISHQILIKICHARVFHYLMYVEIIKIKLKYIHKEAMDASALNKTINESMKSVRETYQMIFDMINYLNRIFGFSHLATVLYCFFFIFTDLNWAYFQLSSKSIESKLGR